MRAAPGNERHPNMRVFGRYRDSVVHLLISQRFNRLLRERRQQIRGLEVLQNHPSQAFGTRVREWPVWG